MMSLKGERGGAALALATRTRPAVVHSVLRVTWQHGSLVYCCRSTPTVASKRRLSDSLLAPPSNPSSTCKSLISSRLTRRTTDANGSETVRFRHLPPRPRLARPRLVAQQLGQRQGETRHRRTEKDTRRHRQGQRYQLRLVGRCLFQRRQQGRINSGPSPPSLPPVCFTPTDPQHAHSRNNAALRLAYSPIDHLHQKPTRTTRHLTLSRAD